ncbi:MAG: long-chain fatty acid--CoA ligase, partial [Achromobacter sp.]|nr:long-chain fatty acid--CoA ligase [Achromobacter sp.]
MKPARARSRAPAPRWPKTAAASCTTRTPRPWSRCSATGSSMQPIDFFLHAAMRYPDRIAAIDAASGFAHTYEALRGQALALAAALQRLSGKPRPVIATLAGNSHAMLLGILATYACGGVLVPLTPTVVEQDIARQLATAAPDIVLHDAAYEALLVSYQGLRICNDESREFQTDALAREYAGQSPSRGNPDPGETTAIKFTGGSSGVPKAVLQSLRCINTMVASLAMAYGFDSKERFLLAPPMTHGAGTFVLPVLHAGGCLVIAGKATAEQLHALLDSYAVTSTWVPPTLLQRLVRGGHDAHVHPHRLRAAHPIEAAFGQHAQQPRLELDRHVADFVQEQRAAVRFLEAAAAQRVGAGESA